MGQVDADAFRALDHRLRRGCPRDHAVYRVVDPGTQRVGRVDQHVVHHRRAAKVGHAMLADQPEDQRRLHFSEAHAGARHQRKGPGKAPAIAVEHGQRPQVHRKVRHGPGDDVADRIDVGTAVVQDDSLGIAGRTRGVVERDRVPFVVGQAPLEIRIAGGEKVVVFDLAQQLAAAGQIVVDVDHQRPLLQHVERFGHGAGQLAVGEQHLGLAMLQHERDRGRIEPRVECVDYGAGHRDAVVRLEHGRYVRRHDGHRITRPDPPALQRRGQAAAAQVSFPPSVSMMTVDHGEAVRVDLGHSPQEGQRAIAGRNWQDSCPARACRGSRCVLPRPQAGR